MKQFLCLFVCGEERILSSHTVSILTYNSESSYRIGVYRNIKAGVNIKILEAQNTSPLVLLSQFRMSSVIVPLTLTPHLTLLPHMYLNSLSFRTCSSTHSALPTLYLASLPILSHLYLISLLTPVFHLSSPFSSTIIPHLSSFPHLYPTSLSALPTQAYLTKAFLQLTVLLFEEISICTF